MTVVHQHLQHGPLRAHREAQPGTKTSRPSSSWVAVVASRRNWSSSWAARSAYQGRSCLKYPSASPVRPTWNVNDSPVDRPGGVAPAVPAIRAANPSSSADHVAQALVDGPHGAAGLDVQIIAQTRSRTLDHR